eukprot:m.17548 g.17548  ORF g.17548 m.17548 type:complete len:244 (+) comp4799_c0_seq1:129-860(+)
MHCHTAPNPFHQHPLVLFLLLLVLLVFLVLYYPPSFPHTAMSSLPREVWLWLQSLQLSVQVRNVRRDLSNGYVVAEIMQKYFPSDIQLHNFHKGTAINLKLENWELLQKLCAKESLEIDPKFINGCIHCKPGAAEPIVKILYSQLTGKQLKIISTNIDEEFSDIEYQASLPSYARSTASVAIKNNLKRTEMYSEPDLIATNTKIGDIMAKQKQLKELDKEMNPKRYNVQQLKSTGRRVLNNQG